MKTKSKLIVLSFLLFSVHLFGQKTKMQTKRKYSATEVKKDFKYLYETLEASSYDLFYYTGKNIFDKEYERINKSISDSLTQLEISRLFQSFVALGNFEHCKIGFPITDYRYFYRNGGRFFPFELAFVDDKPTVSVDYSKNPNISMGDELISIDEVPFQNILDKMYTYMSGENDYARRTTFESGSFMDYYWFVFGDFLGATIQVKKNTGKIITVELKGVNLDEYKEFVNNNPVPSYSNSNREFKFINDVAYLHPGLFLNINSRNEDLMDGEIHNRDDFIVFIDSVFVEIYKRNAQDLIIDIRGNNGGSDAFSNYMMAYFAKRPFKLTSKISMRISQFAKELWKNLDIPEMANLKNQIMTLENGTPFEPDIGETFPRKDSLHFKGNVFVLVDRFSFSMAAAAASIIQDYSLGVIIGEETSTTPSSCGSMLEFPLPNTKITTFFPSSCGVRPNGDASSRGVIPDIIVKQDIFTEKDEVLDYTLESISLGKF